MIYLLRANHANEFELQNYYGIKDLEVTTSHHPLTPITLPSTKLWSPTDLPNIPFRRQILNRLVGGEQWLIGLERYISRCIDDSNHRTILHTAETYTPYTNQAVRLRKAGKIDRLICTCWETIPYNNEKFARLRQWKAEAYKYVDLFHTPTTRAKQALVKEGVDPSKIVVIPYGVDLSRFRLHSLRGQSSQGHAPTVLTVARLEKEKGMEILEQVARRLPNYEFKVIGQGLYTPHGDNITAGRVPYSQIHKLYQSADIFFLPSLTTPTWEEQYGMALVEAMACSLPLVTTRSGAIPEIVGNVGIIHPEKNVDKMVKTIKEIISSPDKTRLMSRASLTRARKLYDAKKQGRLLSQLYA